MKKLLLFLSCILLLAALCACGNDADPAPTDASTDATTETTEATTEEIDYTPQPEDYGKHTFTVLSAGNVAFDVDELMGIIKLIDGMLEAKREQLALEFLELCFKLLV